MWCRLIGGWEVRYRSRNRWIGPGGLCSRVVARQVLCGVLLSAYHLLDAMDSMHCLQFAVKAIGVLPLLAPPVVWLPDCIYLCPPHSYLDSILYGSLCAVLVSRWTGISCSCSLACLFFPDCFYFWNKLRIMFLFWAGLFLSAWKVFGVVFCSVYIWLI